jgi:pilus assembly protein CpaF
MALVESPVEATQASGTSLPTLVELNEKTIRQLLAPVAGALDDKSVSEIMINGPTDIYIERSAVIERWQGPGFATPQDLEAAARSILQFAGRRLSANELSVEARLPDGSRVHVVLPPASRQGICLSIRRFGQRQLNLDQILAAQPHDFLAACIRSHKNMIVSGGTGTGKTTMVGALSTMFGITERIIVIEDVKELQLRPGGVDLTADEDPHVLYFEAQRPDRFGVGGITVRELFKASLRMRPDRIIVGECRSGEALDMIQAMTSGHSGSLSTVHANSPMDAVRRLETLSLMADIDMPLRALRTQVVSAVQIIVQVVRERGMRFVSEVAEVVEVNSAGEPRIESVFLAKHSGHGKPELHWTGYSPTFAADVLVHLDADSLGTSREIWTAKAKDR